MPLPSKSKRALLATAISQMYSIVAADWSHSILVTRFKDVPALDKLSEAAQPLLQLMVEDDLEKLYDTLKLYFKEEGKK